MDCDHIPELFLRLNELILTIQPLINAVQYAIPVIIILQALNMSASISVCRWSYKAKMLFKDTVARSNTQSTDAIIQENRYIQCSADISNRYIQTTDSRPRQRDVSNQTTNHPQSLALESFPL